MSWAERSAAWRSDPDFREELDREFPTLDIATAIVRARADRGWSQRDLADAMDSYQSLVARLESGRRPITTTMLNRVARALGTQLHVTFGQPVAADDQLRAPADPLTAATAWAAASASWTLVAGPYGEWRDRGFGERSRVFNIKQVVLGTPPAGREHGFEVLAPEYEAKVRIGRNVLMERNVLMPSRKLVRGRSTLVGSR